MSTEQNRAPKSRRTGLAVILSLGAAVLALALVGWLLMGRSSRSESAEASEAGALDPSGRSVGGGASRGGIQKREMDEASRRQPKKALDPMVTTQLGGVKPAPEPEPIPTFTNAAEEIAYYEHQLELAKRNLEQRQTFLQRAEAQRQELEAQGDLDAIASRQAGWKTVRENHRRAQSRVEELERKLAELRR